MPDASGRIPLVAYGGRAGATLEKIFGPRSPEDAGPAETAGEEWCTACENTGYVPNPCRHPEDALDGPWLCCPECWPA